MSREGGTPVDDAGLDTARDVSDNRTLADDEAQRRQMIFSFIVIIGLGAIIAGVANFLDSHPAVGVVMCLAATFGVVLGVVLWTREVPLVVAGNLFTAIVFFGAGGASLLSGSFSHPVHYSICLVPLFATLIAGSRSGLAWLAWCALWVPLVAWVYSSGVAQAILPQHPQFEMSLQALGAELMVIVAGLMGVVFQALKAGALAQADRAHAVLERARETAERASEAKSMFLAHMSHEIRTPMNGIVGMLELMREAETLGEAQSRIDVAHESAIVLLRLLNDIVDMSKVEKGKVTIEITRCRLHDLLRGAVAVHESAASSRGLSLELAVHDDLPHIVRTDALRLRQIVTNLVSNALKFTSQGGVTIRAAAVSDDQDGCTLHISVKDTGEGIAPEKLERIFGQFTQADAATTRRFGGAGLGLAIARRLARLMGGDLVVKSALGEGSVFTLTVPVEILPNEDSVHMVRQSARALRLLLVDDVKTNRDVAKAMLKHLGHEVVVAVNGAEAVQRVSEERFDLVLMDCQMPVLDGYSATRQIRALTGPMAAVPILALTGNVMEREIEKSAEAGMNGHLGKPITFARLSAAITTALESQPEGQR